MERGQQVWQKYYYLKRESRVVRSGFGLYGVYDYDPEQPLMVRARSRIWNIRPG